MTKPTDNRAEAVTNGSVAVATAENAFDGARVVGTARHVIATVSGTNNSNPWRAVARWVPRSFVGRSTRRASESITAAWESSTPSRALGRLIEWTNASRLVRWLTAEPEPEVIVIDLRDTLTVGPIIALLDRAVDVLHPLWHQSALKRVIDDVSTYVLEVPIRALSIAVLAATMANLVIGTALGQLDSTELPILLLMFLVAALGLRSTTSWEQLVDSRAGRLLIAVLEPPELPEGDEQPHPDDDAERATSGTDE